MKAEIRTLLRVGSLLLLNTHCIGADLSIASAKSPYAKVEAVPWTEVRWTEEGFWAERLEVCRTNMIPALWRIMEGTNYSQFYENFGIAGGIAQGRHRGASFNDGDFYKWMEAASAMLAITHDASVDRQLDEIIGVIAKAQREDGYIHTPVLIAAKIGEGKKAFEERLQFETYNMGHLLSAACIHFRATGKTNFLNVARKTADFLCATFDHPTPGLARFSICPSHYMGMVEMYRATGEAKYLGCAKKLLAARDFVANGDDDNQDRIPLEQQTDAMGHAVRANYLYAGAADLFLETGDRTLWAPLQKIWSNVVEQKMYITGGCGALFDGASPDGSKDQKSITRVHQAYGRNYELPNLTAHNETCANIANILWNWRMFLATGEGRFMDVVELALYNSVLSGAGLDGTNFFYVNPLRSVQPMPVELRWKHERIPFLSSFCCPPNLARTLAEIGGYAYGKSENAIWVNLYAGNQLVTELGRFRKVRMTQQTEYPWNGRIRIKFDKCPQTEFALKLRVPGWASEQGEPSREKKDLFGLRVNGVLTKTPAVSSGYLPIRRTWRPGDSVDLEFPMPPRMIEANPLVEETANQIAIKRGPVVYCLEQPRSDGSHARMMDVSISADADLVARFDRSLLGGVAVIETSGFLRHNNDWNGDLYRPLGTVRESAIKLQFIPYFAWANRGPMDMTVWLPLTRR